MIRSNYIDLSCCVLTSGIFFAWWAVQFKRLKANNEPFEGSLIRDLFLNFLLTPFLHIYPLLITLRPRFYSKHRSLLVNLGRPLGALALEGITKINLKLGWEHHVKAINLGPMGPPGHYWGLLMPTPDSPGLHLLSGILSQVLLFRTRAVAFRGWATAPWLALETYQAVGPTILTLYLRYRAGKKAGGEAQDKPPFSLKSESTSRPALAREPYRRNFARRKASDSSGPVTRTGSDEMSTAGISSPPVLDLPSANSYSTYKLLGSLRPQDLSPRDLEALTAAVRKQAEAKVAQPVRLALSVYEGCVMLRLSAWRRPGSDASREAWEDVSALCAGLDASVLLAALPKHLRGKVHAVVAVAPVGLAPAPGAATLELPPAVLASQHPDGTATETAGVRVSLVVASAEEPQDPSSRLESLSARYRPVAWETHSTGPCPVGAPEWSLGADGVVRVAFYVQVGTPDLCLAERGIGASLLIAGLEPLPESTAPAAPHTAATADILLLSSCVLSDLRRSSDIGQVDLESDIATLLSLRASPAFREARDEGVLEMVRGAGARIRAFADSEWLWSLASLGDLLSAPPRVQGTALSATESAPPSSFLAFILAFATDGAAAALNPPFQWLRSIRRSRASRRSPDIFERCRTAEIQMMALRRNVWVAWLRSSLIAMTVPFSLSWWGPLLGTLGFCSLTLTGLDTVARRRAAWRKEPLGLVLRTLAMLLILCIPAATFALFVEPVCAGALGPDPAAASGHSWDCKFMRAVVIEGLMTSSTSIGFGVPFALIHAFVAAGGSEWTSFTLSSCRSLKDHDALVNLLSEKLLGISVDPSMASGQRLAVSVGSVLLRVGLTMAMWSVFERRAGSWFVREYAERSRRESEVKERELRGQEAPGSASGAGPARVLAGDQPQGPAVYGERQGVGSSPGAPAKVSKAE